MILKYKTETSEEGKILLTLTKVEFDPDYVNVKIRTSDFEEMLTTKKFIVIFDDDAVYDKK